MWCDACRAVDAIHCAHPDECGNMCSDRAAADNWNAWLDDLPIDAEFHPAIDRLQDFISGLAALAPAASPAPDDAYFAGMRNAADILWNYARAAEVAAAPAMGGDVMPLTLPAWADVLAERRRQVEVEGFKPEDDDAYQAGDLAHAAACYALSYRGSPAPQRFWPWAMSWWKPTTRRRDLVKAAALILAEIERLDRAASAPSQKEADK
jgi:hypothetical protein